MKIQVVRSSEQEISGFLPLTLDKKDLSNVIHNSCTEVLVLNTLNYLEFDEALTFLQALLKRIRLNGTITLTGVHLMSLVQNVSNEIIDSKIFSSIIADIKCVIDTRIIVQILESNNFVIDHLVMTDGNFYELKATRIEP
ncbi:MAG: hypothetical protein EBU90_03610 [Proteobacteria bacterium]|nr:hypothetical protein [Pseudomonadota bacterium]NBP13688.1 hypothetical protein [bacterium]